MPLFCELCNLSSCKDAEMMEKEFHHCMPLVTNSSSAFERGGVWNKRARAFFYFKAFRCRSHRNLKLFIELLPQLKDFLELISSESPNLSDPQWFWRVYIFVSMTRHLNTLNPSLQGNREHCLSTPSVSVQASCGHVGWADGSWGWYSLPISECSELNIFKLSLKNYRTVILKGIYTTSQVQTLPMFTAVLRENIRAMVPWIVPAQKMNCLLNLI